MSPTENRQQPQGGSRRRMTTAAEYKKYIAEGNGYLRGFKPFPGYDYDKDPDPDLIPEGASPEHRPQFKDIWFRYHRQLQTTNGMDLDSFPGLSCVADTVPLKISGTTDEDKLIMELANLAIQEYNEESNVFKYELLKIEKVNSRITGYREYFMTVKVLNVTLVNVVETFQMHAGRSMDGRSKEVFSCLPKGGALDAIAKLDGEGKGNGT